MWFLLGLIAGAVSMYLILRKEETETRCPYEKDCYSDKLKEKVS